MASAFVDFGFINLQLIAFSSATVTFRQYPKPLDKQTRDHSSHWPEEQRPARNLQNVEHHNRLPTSLPSPSRPYRPSLRPSLETIVEQESQICPSACWKVRCAPFRLCRLGRRTSKLKTDRLFSRTSIAKGSVESSS